MRVAEVFKRLLRMDGLKVLAPELVEDEQGQLEAVVIDVARPPRRLMRCGGCGYRTRSVYDRSRRTWRHLDLLRVPCHLRAEVRRIECPRCGVVPEEVPFARPGARFTRAFEDTAAYVAKNAPKSVVANLMRVDWATVGRIIERVVDEALGVGSEFLDGLRRIGIDEVSYRKGHRYLLVVTDHDTGRIVFAHPGRSAATLEVFFAALGPERAALLEAVSVDLYAAWPPVITRRAPQAAICADPFHVVKQAQDALDELRRRDWQELRRTDPEAAKHFKGLRFILRRRADGLAEDERSLLESLEETNERVFRGWLLADQLRGVYRAPDPETAAELLDAWVNAAATSGLAPFVKTAKTLEAHAARIINAIRLGINNARIEAMNSTTRLLSHRSRGFRRVDSLIALIHLVCGRVPVNLPT